MVRREPRALDHACGLVEGGVADLSFWKGKRVVVTGGAGFLGSYVVENLLHRRNVPRADVVIPRSSTHDLRDLANTVEVMQGCQIVIHLAAVTGGIAFSRAHPASQYNACTRIDLNVAEAAQRCGMQKVIAIGNLFAYAAEAPIPLRETCLFDGVPGGPHLGVGWMKRNLAVVTDLYHREYGLPMSAVYSANAYGPGDSVDPLHAHVIPSTIMKCLRESEVAVWGDGSPTRDFLYAADVAEGLLLAAERLEAADFVNLGSGHEVSIRELVERIVRHTGFAGKVTFDDTKGGGDPRRVASVEKARRLLGFQPATTLDDGLRRTVHWYRERLGR